jgi:hypothetical protein
MKKRTPNEVKLSELLDSWLTQGKRFLSAGEVENIFLENEQKAPDPEECIWKPPPNYGADKNSYYVTYQGNVSWTDSVEDGEVLPPGAELVRGPSTTTEMIREFLHPTTNLIANDDTLWRLAYAIDLHRFLYTWSKGAREGRTRQTEAKRRSDRIAEYTKRLKGSNADNARRRLRELWLEEIQDEASEGTIDWIMKAPEQAIERLLLLRRPLFNPWHECATGLAITYVKLFGRAEKLTEERACSKTGTLIHFLRNALEEITGLCHQPAAIAKVLREDVRRSVEKKFRDIG